MVTESVDIVFRESGLKTIKRKLDELGESAASATRGVFLLQRAFFVLGGFGAARSLQLLADSLTNLENRLRLTTTSTRELQKVQTELFAVSRRARSSLEAVGQTYTRTALSAKALGRSQAEVLRFTETVTKAAVLSGATTQEVQASLIQLGQGIASNRLGGDELRSILEQLPLVADVIAQELGVTRGELRKLGSEGKITGEVILDAFKNAKSSIDALFEDTVPTIGQAFTVARTNFLEFIDTFDDANNVSEKVAKSILFISDNMGLLIKAAGAFAAILTVGLIGNLGRAFSSFTAQVRANAVQQKALLDRLISIRQATVAKTQAEISANTARQAQLNQNLALIAQQKLILQQQILDTQYVVKNGLARNIQTGRIVSLTRAKQQLAILNQRLNILDGVEAAQSARLTAAATQRTAAISRLTAAYGRLAIAKNAATFSSRALFAAQTALTASMKFLGAAMSSVFAFLGGWPGIILLAVAAMATFSFSAESATDKFNRLVQNTDTTSSAVAGLQEVQQKLNDTIKNMGIISDEAFASMTENTQAEILAKANLLNLDKQQLEVLQNERRQAAAEYLQQISEIKNRILNIQATIDRNKKSPWGSVSEVEKLLSTVDKLNAEIKRLEDQIVAINSNIVLTDQQINSIGETLKSAYTDVLMKSGGILDNAVKLGSALMTAFTNAQGIASTDMSGTIGSAAGVAGTLAARLGAAYGFLRRMAGLSDSVAPTPTGGSPFRDPTLEADQRRLYGEGRMAAEEAIRNDSALFNGPDIVRPRRRIVRTDPFFIDQLEMYGEGRDAAGSLIREGYTLPEETGGGGGGGGATPKKSIQEELLDSITEPSSKILEQQEALNKLFESGTIGLSDYLEKMKELQLALANTSTTFMGGFKVSMTEAIMTASELGNAIGTQLTSFVNGASDALFEFARTGTLNIREVFDELFINLGKMLLNQGLLTVLAPLLGIKAPTLDLGSLLGFSTGGSILPSGPGTTDTQVVAFRKRPDERVDVLTPAQQRAGSESSSGVTVIIEKIDARYASEGTAEMINRAMTAAAPKFADLAVRKIDDRNKRRV